MLYLMLCYVACVGLNYIFCLVTCAVDVNALCLDVWLCMTILLCLFVICLVFEVTVVWIIFAVVLFSRYSRKR